MPEDTFREINSAKLRQWFTTFFNREELYTLCFDLNVDYENFPITDISKNAIARELITYIIQHKRQFDLLKACQAARPDVPWDEVFIGQDQENETTTEDGSGKPPYKGLSFFDEDDVTLFFGREKLTHKIVTYLNTHTFLAIVGNSGIGKSSLVRAGLIPALKGYDHASQNLLLPEDSAQWLDYIITPTNSPLEKLATSLASTVEEAIALRDKFEKDPRSFRYVANMLLKNHQGKRLLLVVDQFEELFTQCKNEDERQAFINNLMTAADPETPGQTTVVITLRADFYAKCDQYDTLREALAKNQEFIGPLSEKELRLAIEEPALREGWDFQPGLVDWILQEAKKDQGYLPLLSHALLKTWENRRGSTLTFDGYIRAGGLHGAIAQTAESVFEQFSKDEKPIAQNIFLRLTGIGDGKEGTRRRVSMLELIPESTKRASVENVLDKLIKERLVTVSKESVEIIHEALIREWPRLRSWLNEYSADLLIHRRLTEWATDWETHERHRDYLYTGLRLREAEAWEQATDFELNKTERHFLEASVVANRRRNQRQRAALVTFVILMVSLSLLFGFTQNRAATREGNLAGTSQALAGTSQASEQLANNALTRVSEQIVTTEAEKIRAEGAESLTGAQLLVSQGQSLFEEDPLLGLGLVLEGASQINNQAPDNVLINSLQQMAKQGRIGSFSNVENIYVSPDESWFMIDYFGSPGEIRNIQNNVLLTSLPYEIEKVFFSPDGTTFIIDYEQPLKINDTTPTPSPTSTPSPTPIPCITALCPVTGSSFTVPPSNGIVIKAFDGQLLDSGDEPLAELRQVNDTTKISTFEGLIDNVVYSPNGETFVIKRLLVLYGEFRKVSDEGEEGTRLVNVPKEIVSVNYSPDSSLFATLYREDSNFLTEIRHTTNGELFISNERNDYSFSPNGNSIITNLSSDPRVLFINEMEITSITQFRGQITQPVYFSPDGSVVVLDFNADPGLIYQLEAPKRVLVLDNEIKGIYFSPNGAMFIISYTNAPGEIRWVSEVEQSVLLNGLINNIYFSPDEKTFVVDYDKGDPVWELRRTVDGGVEMQGSRLENHPASLHEVKQVHFSSNDGAFLVSYVKDVRVGDLITTGQTYRDILLPSGISYASPSPDGKTLIIDYYESTGELRNFVNGEIIATFRNEIDISKGVDFSPDSSWFILNNKTGRSELWNTQLGTSILDLGIGVAGHFFIPDNQFLIVWYEGGQAYILDLAWLQAINEQGDSLEFNELLQQTCEGLLASRWFDEETLSPYLAGQSPNACP
ncbi:High-affnity carbon uptake protein Hat/HatR [hydrothermal vent metagenome]|uniref:High-affnity carbon uptake protein Hat/HatR n=1 Tax=hydrothermal vent metagenome TaxID=652676 RepID=A0A3B0UVH4_9ZZZZ